MKEVYPNTLGSERTVELEYMYSSLKKHCTKNTKILDVGGIPSTPAQMSHIYDLINSNKEWEIAIFNLINDCLISKCRLIFSSSFNPSSIKFDLKDLISRIKKMDHVELFPVSEDKLNDALNFICNLRSINLGEKEINYLVTYSKRNISDLINIINKLDKILALIEEGRDEKTGHVTEEIILYSFIGVFMIFIVDSFARAGKYVR